MTDVVARFLNGVALLVDVIVNVNGEPLVVQGFAVFGEDGIFAALALGKDGVLVAACQGGFQGDPAAMKVAANRASVGNEFTEPLDQALEFAGKSHAFHGELPEEFLEGWIPDFP